uniref:DUF3108 domain-containing protein n=1 Tax=candidate division WOR-3 bacterium TaxID=2052148 RepID=A0A7C4GDB6_UNCW3
MRSSRLMAIGSLLTIGIVALGLLSCDTVLFRAGQDYFPLVPGSEWRYAVGNDTVTVTVDTAPAVAANRACTRLYRNLAAEYWVKSRTEVLRLYTRIEILPQGEDTIEHRFGRVYELPLVEGATWQVPFKDTLVFLGTDTIFYSHSLTGRVAAIEDVTVPAGEYTDCYRIELAEEIICRDTTRSQWTEWLAPGVGIVKRRSATTEELLASYRKGP